MNLATMHFLKNRPWWPSGLRRYLKIKQRECLRFQVQIPIRNYNIDRSEVEILCHYSNSRAPGDMCRLQYQTKRDAIVPKNWFQFVGNSSTYEVQYRWHCGCGILAGTESLNEDGSPPHPKARTVKLKKEVKVVKKTKQKKQFYYKMCKTEFGNFASKQM